MVILNEKNIAIHAGDFQFDGEHPVLQDGTVDVSVRMSECTVLDAPPPQPWRSCGWRYENGAFVMEPWFDALLKEDAFQGMKAARHEEVRNIVVTTESGRSFDGDEDSQNRMSRAINSLSPGETTHWVLADNTPTFASREELQEALRLAGEAQTAIWMRPYL